MARESKRKRDEKRFGRAERLADIILNHGPADSIPRWARNPRWADGSVQMLLDEFKSRISDAAVVDASNVADYYYSQCEKSEWDCMEDFPSCRPAFPRMFVEFRRPSVYRDERGCRPFDPSFYERWGWLVESLPAARLPRDSGNPGLDRELVPMLDLPGVHSIVRMMLAFIQGGKLMAGFITYYAPIDELGRMLTNHKFTASSLDGDDTEMMRAACTQTGQLSHVAYLTFSFMNCKNVAVERVEPNGELNRERKKAGLKPFVRYHTINIEPMKKVLRTEGGIEANGLKKALHIVRGHFSTYNEDKPLFGRPGLHGRFWMPSHVRGSLDNGVVVSDYRVNAPKAEVGHP